MGAERESTRQDETGTPVRRSRRRWVIAGTIILGAIASGTYGLAWYRYQVAIAYQMPLLAGAIWAYNQQYEVIPPTLQAIRDSGIYGMGATRLPGNIWEGWNEHTGPEPLYLPVFDWDGETQYVMAVQPPMGYSPRVYVVAGDTSVHRATEHDLGEILARDDELRAATSQPGRWRDMPWQTSAHVSR